MSDRTIGGLLVICPFPQVYRMHQVTVAHLMTGYRLNMPLTIDTYPYKKSHKSGTTEVGIMC